MNCTLADGTIVPALGQGTWYLGENLITHDAELRALRTGIENGMTLLDTAEMYGDGRAESLIGELMPLYDRSKLFIVSKVYPHNAGRRHIFTSCENSLKRLRTDYLDMYLLHWRGSISLAETVECMETLVKQGKIRRWGVSNFDLDDMHELWSVPNGNHCMVNQVLYHVASRGIEYDLLPWMREKNVALMAYCPLAQAGRLRRGLMDHPVLKQIAEKYQISVPQLLLAFTLRDGHTISIPRTGVARHTVENSLAIHVTISDSDMALINQAFPAPTHRVMLDMQ